MRNSRVYIIVHVVWSSGGNAQRIVKGCISKASASYMVGINSDPGNLLISAKETESFDPQVTGFPRARIMLFHEMCQNRSQT